MNQNDITLRAIDEQLNDKSSTKFNPELMSNKPTHIDRRQNLLVKVFTGQPGYENTFTSDGKKSHTAEIMEGKDKGKWTTVYDEDLIRVVI